MAWWAPLAIGYGITLFAGVATAPEDEPMGEFVLFWLVFGTLLTVAMYVGGWLA